MRNVVGGWKRSSPEQLVGVPQFKSSPTLQGLAAANTGSAYTIPNSVPIFDQGQLDSCVANSTCAGFEILANIANSSDTTALSRLFLYWNARVYIQSTNQDAGCYIHDALNSLSTLGICEESLWPYDESEVLVQPPIAAYQQGNANTIIGFSQITDTGTTLGDSVELAVRANHPVVFGTLVSNEYAEYDGNGIGVVWDIPNENDLAGGHAQLIVGVQYVSGARQFLVRNSWGSSWSDNGTAWFTEAYIEWSQTSDIFVATLMPNLLV
jgi:C1A family cysteine protease